MGVQTFALQYIYICVWCLLWCLFCCILWLTNQCMTSALPTALFLPAIIFSFKLQNYMNIIYLFSIFHHLNIFHQMWWATPVWCRHLYLSMLSNVDHKIVITVLWAHTCRCRTFSYMQMLFKVKHIHTRTEMFLLQIQTCCELEIPSFRLV